MPGDRACRHGVAAAMRGHWSSANLGGRDRSCACPPVFPVSPRRVRKYCIVPTSSESEFSVSSAIVKRYCVFDPNAREAVVLRLQAPRYVIVQ